jgi:hypothetical protein
MNVKRMRTDDLVLVISSLESKLLHYQQQLHLIMNNVLDKDSQLLILKIAGAAVLSHHCEYVQHELSSFQFQATLFRDV